MVFRTASPASARCGTSAAAASTTPASTAFRALRAVRAEQRPKEMFDLTIPTPIELHFSKQSLETFLLQFREEMVKEKYYWRLFFIAFD
jgi:hypothetical protein